MVKVEIEDLLRETLVVIAKDQLGWDASEITKQQEKRPIVDIMSEVAKDKFSKYQLAKAFVRWSRDHKLDNLTKQEICHAKALVEKVNKALT